MTADACLACMNPDFNTQHNIKLHMLVYACNSTAQEVETGGSEIQSYPQQYNEFKANLSFIRHRHGKNGGATS